MYSKSYRLVLTPLCRHQAVELGFYYKRSIQTVHAPPHCLLPSQLTWLTTWSLPAASHLQLVQGLVGDEHWIGLVVQQCVYQYCLIWCILVRKHHRKNHGVVVTVPGPATIVCLMRHDTYCVDFCAVCGCIGLVHCDWPSMVDDVLSRPSLRNRVGWRLPHVLHCFLFLHVFDRCFPSMHP